MKRKATEERKLVDRTYIRGRWMCSNDTLRRRERAGHLTPIRLGPNSVRYDLAEVLRYEDNATA